MQGSLDARQQDKAEVKRKLVGSSVDLNQAYRDFAIEITISRFSHSDFRELASLLKESFGH